MADVHGDSHYHRIDKPLLDSIGRRADAAVALVTYFVISGDAILSFYANPTGRYRGFECIQQRDERRYSVRGAVMEEDKVITTWTLELTAGR